MASAHLTRKQFKIDVLSTWKSNTTGANYPASWNVAIPSEDIQLTLKPYIADQEMRVMIYYSWRPATPDPADEHIVDCAMNAGAVVVTFNERDFRAAQQTLGLRVMTPVELVAELATA